MVSDEKYVFFWRIVAIGSSVIWSVTVLINWIYLEMLNYQPTEQVLMPPLVYFILSGCTFFCLVFLIVYPQRFIIYAVMFCFWGLVNLADGGDLAGLLLYGLGCAFAYKDGYFKTFFKSKISIGIVLVLSTIGFQYRYSLDMVIRTFFRCLSLFLIGGIGMLLFLPELHNLRRKHVPEQAPNPADVPEDTAACFPQPLSEQDRAILDRIRKGEKYECIAIELGLSVPTVKRRVKRLFRILRVSDRTEFLMRYGAGLPASL